MKTSLLILGLILATANAINLHDKRHDHGCPADDDSKPLSAEASAAALKVVVAAKKDENDYEIKVANNKAKKASKAEASRQIKDALEDEGMDNEKKAIESAVNVVENIRKKKMAVHDDALKKIEDAKEN